LPPILAGDSTPLRPTIADGTIAFASYPFNPLPESVDSTSNSPIDLIYSFRLGGSDQDVGRGIAVAASGAAYVTGLTWWLNFPITPGAFQQYNGGGLCSDPPIPCSDAFVTKLNPDGSGLAYSTFLAGSDIDIGIGIAGGAMGMAYVTGETCSSDFPIRGAAFQPGRNPAGCEPWHPCADAFVAKFDLLPNPLTPTLMPTPTKTPTSTPATTLTPSPTLVSTLTPTPAAPAHRAWLPLILRER